MSLLASVATLGSVGAVSVGSAELAVCASAGVVAAAAHLVRVARGRRRHAWLARFLGSDAVVVGPGTWTSPDASRRVRATSTDTRVRFERLDPCTGEVLRSVRGPSPLAPPPPPRNIPRAGARSTPEEWQVATLHGRALRPLCFEGLPRELSGRSPRLADARYVLHRQAADGVLVERRDALYQLVGDTLHSDLRSALAALDEEYGSHLGVWRSQSTLHHREPAPPRSAWGGALPLRARW